MTGVRRIAVVLALVGSSLLPAGGAAGAEPGYAAADWSVRPAVEAARRLLPDHVRRIRFVAEQPGPDGGDHYRIGARNGLVEIGGTSPAVLLTGLHAYLGEVADANVSWTGEQLDLPSRLPLPDEEIVRPATVTHRFALNDTDDGYTGPYRDWADWERLIDVLALHGVNEVFVPVGAEAVYYDTFQRFGYTADELRGWIPPPAHQPWWLLQNMCCFPSPVSSSLIEERAELGRRIADRLRELGMTPVLPGYFGTVPTGFEARNPGAKVVPQGDWVGFERPGWLDPTGAHFPRVAAEFYRSSRARFGDSAMYKMDLLHEGGTAGDVDVAAASVAVEDALQAAHPGAIWAILGWQNNPRPETLAAVDTSRMLIVDGLSDRYDGLDREESWQGAPYAFGSIWNFGGHTTMGANAGVWNERFFAWRDRPGSALDGIAVLPEAGENNPAALDLLTSLAWRDCPVDLDAWFADWADRRYGAPSASARAAWQALGRTAYAMPSGGWSEAQDGLFGAEPSLIADRAAEWSPSELRYDAAAFAAALPALLDVAPELRSSSAYAYDLADVARQALANRGRLLLPALRSAYEAGDLDAFRALTEEWMTLLELVDEVAATNPHWLLGRWLADARSWGTDAAESDRLEHDARTLLSVWGTRAGAAAGLTDYANREWSGLVSTYYAPRWRAYFSSLEAALVEGRVAEAIDWYEFGATWAARTDSLPVTPSGDVHEVAGQVLEHLTTSPLALTASAEASRPVVTAEAPTRVNVTVTNPNEFAAATDVAVEVVTPDGLTATPAGPVASLPPGGSATVEVEVSVTAPPADLVVRLPVRVTADGVPAGGVPAGSVRLLTDDTVEPPYATASFNEATFGQRGDRFAIAGGGGDLWGGTNEFGAVYRDGALSDGTAATTTVFAQDPTWPWARAGLIARDDLAVQGSAGYANIAVTPGNGCVFSWDANGDGRLDSVRQAPGFTAPVHVRLTRRGSSFAGECSSDGSAWTEVGSAALPAAAAVDVGVFMSAVNVVSGATGLVEFDGFRIEPVSPLAGGSMLAR
ncbi:Regulation of enolase protein 1, concanavalin A-like superfamily [Jiangella alkaliphila]|uniref:Regulation of enolase protein 1, concanavalin A-like superfamily n=1 Tax=Jiangella alkaliphila TaxID=419479 RepID=A0A1H2IKP1_9ACTN|nr:Regulation of enolase protein 1, concanavalin A-like superfamily [Jiangella alkaliphila]